MSRQGDSSRLLELLDRIRGRRVVVLGDLVADRFLHGDIARISREAPVLILEHRRTVTLPGGGGNAVANLRALDAFPIPVGVVGNDEEGRGLLEWMRRARVPVSGVRTLEGYNTPSKSRILAGGIHTRRQQIVRLDGGARHGDLPPRARAGIRSRLRVALRNAHGLLVADYGYGAATPDTVGAVREGWGHDDLLVTVDSRARVREFKAVTACTPNQEELERALSLPPLRTPPDVTAAGRRLLKLTGNRAVLVTQGARGMCLLERNRRTREIPAFGSGEVADVTGAGDTVIAVFTLALAAGATFADAASLANYAAGLVVMKAGTATLGRGELARAIREDTPR